MVKRLLTVFLFCAIALSVPNFSYAYLDELDEGERLRQANIQLLPRAVQATEEEGSDGIWQRLKNIFGNEGKGGEVYEAKRHQNQINEQKVIRIDPESVDAQGQGEVDGAYIEALSEEIIKEGDVLGLNITNLDLSFLWNLFSSKEEWGFKPRYYPSTEYSDDRLGAYTSTVATESGKVLATSTGVTVGDIFQEQLPAALQNGSSGGATITPGGPTITPGGPSITPLPGGLGYDKCPYGTGDCSVDNLQQFFPELGAAQRASVICQKESGSKASALNDGCLIGETVDYSIGLFQINLLAHCPGALTFTWKPIGCQIIDYQKLYECQNRLLIPEENIKEALRISSGGTNWDPWSTALPQHCDIPEGTTPLTGGSSTVRPIEDYVGYYQNDPQYASIPLPSQADCVGKVGTYINAACGPFTALNAINNDGFSVAPKEFIDANYPNMSCNGTSMSTNITALTRYGYETEYLFTGAWNPDNGKWGKTQSEVVQEFKAVTDAGWFVWGNGAFWSETSDRWIHHHFLVTSVRDGRIYVLDPYYGYGREIPMDQTYQEVRYKNVFKFRKKQTVN